MPRVATGGRPLWSRGLGTLGSAATVGDTAATSTVMGARGSVDVEPDRQRLGILEQQDMDADLIERCPRNGAGYKPPQWLTG